MAKKAYIVLQHTFKPQVGQNTSQNNFLENGVWEMFEEVFFVTRVRKRWWQEATTIINLTESKVEVNRAETRDYKDILQHVQIKYPQHYNNFVKECKEGGLIKKGA